MDIIFNRKLINEIEDLQQQSDVIEEFIEESLDKNFQSVNGEIKVLETNRKTLWKT